MPVSDPHRLCEAQGPLRATAHSLHLWFFSLHSGPDCLELCRQQLSAPELARAARFVHLRDREEFIIAHGVMRSLLGRYCNQAAGALRFGAGPAGKPFLESQGAGVAPIAFNLSHSGGRALLAVSSGREIGVDLERLNPDIEPLAIGGRYFFGPEFADIAAAPQDQRHERFFRYWVTKEAVLKAQGVGLGFALDGFRVRFAPDGTGAEVDSFDLKRQAGDWRLHLPSCEPGWFAAVCAAGADWRAQLMT